MDRGAARLGKAVKGRAVEISKTEQQVQNIIDRHGSRGVDTRLLQHDIKQLEEYERTHQLQMEQRQRLKKQIAEEAKLTRVNRLQLHQKYRQFMREEKTQQLKNEVEILQQNHERDLERRDDIVKQLFAHIEHAEEQFAATQSRHMQQVDTLASLHHSKIDVVLAEFERDLNAIKREFLMEKDEIISKHTRDIAELNAMIAMVQHDEEERVNEARHAHETEREEIRNKNLEAINELRIHLENRIEDLERQFDDAHHSYVENTEAANTHFKRLKQDDAVISMQIFERKKKIIRYQLNLASWRKKIEYSQKEDIDRNSAIRLQKEAIARHCASLKARMKRFRQSESRRLTELTVMSRNALSLNKKKLEKAERILMLAELSRKAETEREKVMPFYKSTQRNANSNAVEEIQLAEHVNQLSSTNVEDDRSMKLLDEHPLKSIDADSTLNSTIDAENSSTADEDRLTLAIDANGQPIEHWKHLENFYKRYNKVLLDTLAIKAERKRLLHENNDLRDVLRQYLDGVAIPQDVMDQQNTLLIVNGRVNLDGQQIPTTIRHSQPLSGRIGLGSAPIRQDATQIVQTQILQGLRAS